LPPLRAALVGVIRALLRDPLALSRVAFGFVFLLRTTPILAPFEPSFLRGTNGWLGWPDGGWHIPAFGLALPPVLVSLLVVARTLGALALMLGVYPRASGLVAGVAGYLVLAQDAFGYFHHLHMLYLGAILFALVDRDQPRSSLWMLRLFVASIYVWAVIGKLASEWGTGVPLTVFLASGALDRDLVGALLATPERCAIVEIVVMIVEISLAFGLLHPRTRRLTLVAAFAVHAAFEVVGRVDSIGWQMAALLLVFTGSEPRDADTRSTTARTSRP
jgi:uncharacterized membrane protein YphA (DoxX/SURF4 family)